MRSFWILIKLRKELHNHLNLSSLSHSTPLESWFSTWPYFAYERRLDTNPCRAEGQANPEKTPSTEPPHRGDIDRVRFSFHDRSRNLLATITQHNRNRNELAFESNCRSIDAEILTCLTLFFEGDTRNTPRVRSPVFSKCLMHCLTIHGTASHSPGGPPPPLSLSSSTPESLPVRAPPFDDKESHDPPWNNFYSFQSLHQQEDAFLELHRTKAIVTDTQRIKELSRKSFPWIFLGKFLRL